MGKHSFSVVVSLRITSTMWKSLSRMKDRDEFIRDAIREKLQRKSWKRAVSPAWAVPIAKLLLKEPKRVTDIQQELGCNPGTIYKAIRSVRYRHWFCTVAAGAQPRYSLTDAGREALKNGVGT